MLHDEDPCRSPCTEPAVFRPGPRESLSRRGFIQTTALAGAVLTLGDRILSRAAGVLQCGFDEILFAALLDPNRDRNENRALFLLTLDEI